MYLVRIPMPLCLCLLVLQVGLKRFISIVLLYVSESKHSRVTVEHMNELFCTEHSHSCRGI